jgi:plastocyanin
MRLPLFFRYTITPLFAATLTSALIALLTVTTNATHAHENTENVQVSIINMKFEPARIVIKAGSTVKWINQEKRTNHSVLFEKAEIQESDRLFPGDTWEYKFQHPGRYPYICGPHPHMKAEIVVTP